jgi:hypothetical protein
VSGGVEGDGLAFGEERLAALFVLVNEKRDASVGGRLSEDDAGIGDERRNRCRGGGGDVCVCLLRSSGQDEENSSDLLSFMSISP